MVVAPPTAGMSALTVSSLVVYPIKSAGGIAVEQVDVDDFGLRHDRRWMVVDPRGGMITQRTHPRLALARPALEGDRLVVRGPGLDPLSLPLRPAAAVGTTVGIWEDECTAAWQGEAAASWFSRLLEAEVMLVYMPDTTWRPVDPTRAPASSRVGFADAFPFLLLSEESLADLNARLPAPVPMNRFRPNLVIRGGTPFVEDRLDAFGIGEIGFRAVKPCDRCVITTTDQETTERGVEPLRTLATFRKVDGKVYFGQNALHHGPGRLAVGMPVRL
ncbi:MAG TPA: MOSC N-terminal beta barrel domain-containing protein [Gemmatimonadales bacterium]|nr:MOSC N-terminal beta barrel domain-containing protein [Gemmatimonadales bacterium]